MGHPCIASVLYIIWRKIGPHHSVSPYILKTNDNINWLFQDYNSKQYVEEYASLSRVSRERATLDNF